MIGIPTCLSGSRHPPSNLIHPCCFLAFPAFALPMRPAPELQMLQMKYQVSGEAFQHDPGLQESLTLTSSTVRPQGQLLVGRLVDGELLVRPFNAVLRMRPDFCQVDEERRRLDAVGSRIVGGCLCGLCPAC